MDAMATTRDLPRAALTGLSETEAAHRVAMVVLFGAPMALPIAPLVLRDRTHSGGRRHEARTRLDRVGDRRVRPAPLPSRVRRASAIARLRWSRPNGCGGTP